MSTHQGFLYSALKDRLEFEQFYVMFELFFFKKPQTIASLALLIARKEKVGLEALFSDSNFHLPQ